MNLQQEDTVDDSGEVKDGDDKNSKESGEDSWSSTSDLSPLVSAAYFPTLLPNPQIPTFSPKVVCNCF